MQIMVDKNFARFGEKSYAIDKINTIEVRAVHPYGCSELWACAILGALFAYGAYNALSEGNSPTVPIILCFIFWGISYWLWHRSKIVQFQLFLMTSSASVEAYCSFDREEINDLRAQIEAAMIDA